MKIAKRIPGKRCPHCGGTENITAYGTNHSGTKRFKCRDRGKVYTDKPKNRAYSESKRREAIKAYYSGMSGRAVGKLFGMSKANVYNWIKKTE